MFNQDFYPTPSSLATKMLEGLDLSGKCVLDPSAGKGDLLRACKYAIGKSPAQLLAIEVVPELQAILRGNKDYKVVGDDFLQYSGNIWADVIIMNPPFSAVGKHLRRAWDMLRSGDLVSIIPASMIWTPTAEESALLEELRYAGATFENAGTPFTYAERKTNVEVYIVRAKKTAESLMDFGGLKGGTGADGFTFKDMTAGELISSNKMDRLVQASQGALNGFADVLRACNNLIATLNILPPQKLWKNIIASHIEKGTGTAGFNDFAFELQGYIWEALFDQTNISAAVSSKVRAEFQALRQKAGGVDLTPENIRAVFEMIEGNTGIMMQDCLDSAFDLMTKHHKANRMVIKNYATNDAWMVKNKVILPYTVEVSYSDRLQLNWHQGETLDDIDKALCFLSKVAFKTISEGVKDFHGYKSGTSMTTKDAVYRACHGYHLGDNESEGQFFRVKVFKTGTAHLYWKDQDLLDQFNAKVCQGRGWLPGDYGKSYRRKDQKTEGYEI